MKEYTLPDFEKHDHGECELCYEEDVDLFIIPGYLRVCKYCLENNVDICSRCGTMWASDAIDWTYTDDDQMFCEDCAAESEDDNA